MILASGEMQIVREVSMGAGPRLAIAWSLLDTPVAQTHSIIREVLAEAARLEPERADLELLLGRFELLAGLKAPQTVLRHWRRARDLEPLQPLPSRFATEFREVFGDLPELRTLTDR